MDLERIQVLTNYLSTLAQLASSGTSVYREINLANRAIEQEISSIMKTGAKVLDVDHHIAHHPLIIGIDGEPTIRDSVVTVREILHALSRGESVHDICEKTGLNINQVSGAITFAAYVVSDGIYWVCKLQGENTMTSWYR